MPDLIVPSGSAGATPVRAVTVEDWPSVSSHQSAAADRAASAAKFIARAGQIALWWGEGEAPEGVYFGLGEAGAGDPTLFRALAAGLPPGDYRLAEPPGGLDPDQLALAWTLGGYRFDRYKAATASAAPRLEAPAGCNLAWVLAAGEACARARDMINTPANDMGPGEIERAAREIAEAHGAKIEVTVGEALLAAGYPAVHAVGRAAGAGRAPRLIEMTWGRADHPLVALVGKGVAFDSGGLDIKPSASMRLMKKDMGGAAHVLALAGMIMAAALPVRVLTLVPAVENAIAGDAMRPGDILASRKGLTIEVGNTDAEGRLILADALARAAEFDPALTIDMATLTGAARVALGPQVVPFFTPDNALAADLAAAAARLNDPLWRMPLYAPYGAALESDVADIRNDPDPWAQAGCVTAALFLEKFAPKGAWAHFDLYAWNGRARPGHPAGAEIQAIRALFEVVKARF